jgi:enediyne biosynthesis protein E4
MRISSSPAPAATLSYHNNGNGTFTDVTAASGIGGKPPDTLSVVAAWFDYDNDGLLDLIVDNYTTWTPQTDIRCTMGGAEYYCDPRRYKSVPPRLYHNLGKGKFEDVTVKSGLGAAPGKGMGISIADFNNDGWPDIFIANDTEPNSLFINRKNGTFEEKGLELGVAYNDSGHTGSSMGADAKDYDNDGNVDIFYNNLTGQVWQLLRNDGELFRYAYPSKVQTLSLPFAGWSNGFIDYNNDGWKDIYSANGDVDQVTRSRRSTTPCSKTPAGKPSSMSPPIWARTFKGSATSAARPSETSTTMEPWISW